MSKRTKLLLLATVAICTSANLSAANDVIFRYSHKVMSVETLQVGNLSIEDQYVGESFGLNSNVAGGIAPYTWTHTGDLPSGIDFNSAGRLSGTPTTAGSFGGLTFTVTDSVGDKASFGPITLSVYNQLAGGELHDVLALEVSQSKPIPVSGGKSPHQFSIMSGSLPQGMSISSGSIVGTPTQVESTMATVQVRDANGRTAQVDVALSVRSKLVASATFNDGYVGENYTGQFSAVGGSEIYSWSVGTGSLPSNLTLSSTSGFVSGYFDTAGTYEFSGSVSDGYTFDSAAVTLNAYDLPSLASKTYSDPYVGTAYSASEGAAPSASGGKAPFTWSATGLPTGLAINSLNGQITGTPTSAGVSNATITVSDRNNRTASTSASFASRQALAVTDTIPSLVKMTEAVNATASATGGSPPYVYTAIGLPAGLSINSTTGEIAGTPSATGNFTAQITVADANGKTASSTKSIVSEAGVIVATMSGGNGATTLRSHFSETDWASATPKVINLPAGQVRGVQTGQNVVTVGGAWGGTLTFNVAGEIQGTAGYGGAGGAGAQGGNGGNALYVETAGASGQKLTLNLTGAIRAGGGGGGIGGWGGQGGQGVTQTAGAMESGGPIAYCWNSPEYGMTIQPGCTSWGMMGIQFNGLQVGSMTDASTYYPGGMTVGDCTYYPTAEYKWVDMLGNFYGVNRRCNTIVTVIGGAGGNGGNGGYGQGYGTAVQGGSTGTTGAVVSGAGTGGAGGNGGNGGSWGAAGGSGVQGGAGTNGGAGGNAGAIGGQPGYAIVGNRNIDRLGGGIVNGPTQ